MLACCGGGGGDGGWQAAAAEEGRGGLRLGGAGRAAASGPARGRHIQENPHELASPCEQ